MNAYLMMLLVSPQRRRSLKKGQVQWWTPSALSCSRLHHERPHIWVGWERSRSGGRRSDATSVHPEGGEGPALLHQTLQHRWFTTAALSSTQTQQWLFRLSKHHWWKLKALIGCRTPASTWDRDILAEIRSLREKLLTGRFGGDWTSASKWGSGAEKLGVGTESSSVISTFKRISAA